MQKPELKRTSANIMACVVLAMGSVAFGGAATAATDNASDAGKRAQTVSPGSNERANQAMHRRGDHKRGHHHRHYRMGNAAMLVPGYGPVSQDVVDSLALNAQQTALLDDARSFIDEHRKSQRKQQSKATGERSPRALSTPLDPHAAVKRQAERSDTMQQLRAEGSQKWLTVWDSLDSQQQQTLSDYVVNRHEQRAKRRAEHKEKRIQRKGADS